MDVQAWFESLAFWQLALVMYFNGIVVYLLLSPIMSLLMDKPGHAERKRKDFYHSLLNLAGLQGFVFNIFFAWVVRYQPGRVYSDFVEYTMLVTLFNFICFFLLKDLGFYVIHRIAHENTFMYKYTHYIHHQCRPSNAFSSTALDFWDITITTLLPLYVSIMLVPIHTMVFYVFLMLDFFWSHFIHSSCGVYLGPYINSPWHHNSHHQLGQQNKFYGLYTCIWDIIFENRSTVRLLCSRSGAEAIN